MTRARYPARLAPDALAVDVDDYLGALGHVTPADLLPWGRPRRTRIVPAPEEEEPPDPEGWIGACQE